MLLKLIFWLPSIVPPNFVLFLASLSLSTSTLHLFILLLLHPPKLPHCSSLDTFGHTPTSFFPQLDFPSFASLVCVSISSIPYMQSIKGSRYIERQQQKQGCHPDTPFHISSFQRSQQRLFCLKSISPCQHPRWY